MSTIQTNEAICGGKGSATIKVPGQMTALMRQNGNPLGFLLMFCLMIFAGGTAEGQKLTFDGIDDYVIVQPHSSMETNVGTIEAWVRPTWAANTRPPGNPTIVGMRPVEWWMARYSFHLNNALDGLGMWNGSSYNSVAFSFTQNQWYHVAFVYSTTNCAVYVDGNFVGNTNNGIAASNTGIPLRIGIADNVGFNESWLGDIEEVRVWNTQRTETQLEDNMNCDVPQQTALVAYYRFDEGIAGGNNTGSTVVTDYSGNNNCGALMNFTRTGTASNYTAAFISACNSIIIPAPGITSGTNEICVGQTTDLDNTVAGGAWSSSNTGRATVNASTGVVTGISAGTVNITYLLNCRTTIYGVTVNPVAAVTLGNNGPLCAPATLNLTSSLTGGTSPFNYSWSGPNTFSSTNANPTIPAATAAAAGVYTLTVTDAKGCGTTGTKTMTATVRPTPGPIGGNANICIGTTNTLTNGLGGGTWASTNVTIATVNASGAVNGIALGNATIIYTVDGCSNSRIVSVNPFPAAITGGDSVVYCVGKTTVLSNVTTPGVWSATNSSIATVNAATGVVTGTGGGATNISYTNSFGCSVTKEVTVNATLAANTGTGIVCLNQPFSVAVLGNVVPGGIWSSSNESRAKVSPHTGVIKGVGLGTAIITYSLGSGCQATSVLTVNPAVNIIIGDVMICPGTTSMLTNFTAGGTWSSSDTLTATISPAGGMVTGIHEGQAIISYIVNAGCYKTTNMTIYGAMNPIAGIDTVCQGATTTLTSGPAAGTWSSSHTTAAIHVTSGVLTGMTSGTSRITYRNSSTGCFVTRVITVNPAASAITGATSLCPGDTVQLSNSAIGGTWTSSNSARAAIDASTGELIGISSGTATITYATSPTCYSTRTQTVHNTPANIGGTAAVCEGATTALYSSAGGTWSSSNTATATVSTTGVVRGIDEGVTTISYRIAATGCETTREVTVNAVPAALTGTMNVCAGSTTTLSSATTGGVWTSSNVAKATVDAATGVVTGISAGTSNITLTSPAGCNTRATVIVNAKPAAITGSMTVAQGGTTILSCANTGGTWSSADTGIAAFNPTTGGRVSGVSAGATTVTYQFTGTGCYRTRDITVVASRPGATEETQTSNIPQSVFSVYPNPTNGIINVATANGGKLTVFTTDGKEVHQFMLEAGVTTIALPNDLATGMYICQFAGTDGTASSVRLMYMH
jgi:uncharacterized protein YjdB